MNFTETGNDDGSAWEDMHGRKSMALGSKPQSILIEGVDSQGRPSVRSIENGALKFKRKSDLANPEIVYGRKSRISIKPFTKEHHIIKPEEDPFGREVTQQTEEFGRPSQKLSKNNNSSKSSQERLSKRVSSERMQSENANKVFGQAAEEGELESPDEEFLRKMSIRSINVTNHMHHLQAQSTTFLGNSILSRASHLLMSKKHNEIASGSIILDEHTNLVEDEEDQDLQSQHRCSMIKRYNMPTFFASQPRTLPLPLIKTPLKPHHQHCPTLDFQVKSHLLSKTELKETTVASKSLVVAEEIKKSYSKPEDEPFAQKQDSYEASGSAGLGDEVTVLNLLAHQASSSPNSGLIVQGQANLQAFSFVMEEGKEELISPKGDVDGLERLSNIVMSNLGVRVSAAAGESLTNEEQKIIIVDESSSSNSVVQESIKISQEPGEYENTKVQSKFEGMVTKVQAPVQALEGITTADIHRQHYLQTMQALENIARNFAPPPSIELLAQKLGGRVFLPEPERPDEQRKLAIFDMDETLIHCVDDVERDNPDVVLEIDFSPEGNGQNPEDIVCAGINIRPYAIECLEEANKNFQVIVFTASHQTYADAILDYLDPDRRLIQHRLYRHHCYPTPEGFYVKDLRVIANRELSDMVLVDNSVYSFAYQLANGVPIVSFYQEPPQDEEMLHLMYYLSCLAQCQDVRLQNRQAFDLHSLAGIPFPEEETLQHTQSETGTFEMIPEVQNEDEDDQEDDNL